MKKDVPNRCPAARLGREIRLHTTLDRLRGGVFSRSLWSRYRLRAYTICAASPVPCSKKICLPRSWAAIDATGVWHARSMCVAGRDLKLPTIVLCSVKKNVQYSSHASTSRRWKNASPTPVAISSADLEESMFNVGFCVQHYTRSATLHMFDCVTAELLLRKVHLGACTEMCNGAYKCSDFAQTFLNMKICFPVL